MSLMPWIHLGKLKIAPAEEEGCFVLAHSEDSDIIVIDKDEAAALKKFLIEFLEAEEGKKCSSERSRERYYGGKKK